MPLETDIATVDPDLDLEPTETPAENAESPTTVEAPPAPAEGAEATDLETPLVPAAQARDAQGGFTKADGALSAPGEAAPSEIAEPEDLDALVERGDYDRFSFRAEGQDWDYDGAVQDEDGNVLFTPQAVRSLQQDLAYARAYPRLQSESQRALSQEKASREAAQATTQAVLGKLDQLFEQSQGATTIEELMETPLGKWVLDRFSEWPKLRAEGLQAGFGRKSKEQEAELERYRSQEQETQQRPLMLDRGAEAIGTWGKEAGRDAATLEALYQQYTQNDTLDVLFPRLSQDNPQKGLRAGQRDENLEPLRRELLLLHRVMQRNGRQSTTAADVKAENERRTG